MGVPNPIIIDAQEMYGEFFDIPAPDELIFISSFTGGEVFRSGCTFRRGHGKIFFFSPGDQDYPVYHHNDVRRVIANGVEWVISDRPEAGRPGPAALRDRRLLQRPRIHRPDRETTSEESGAMQPSEPVPLDAARAIRTHHPGRRRLDGPGLAAQLSPTPPDAVLVGLVDLDTDVARQAADETGHAGVAVAGTLEELLDRVDADAVVNVTIPAAHHSVSNAALRHGLPVLCEKPLAETVSTGLSMAAAAELTGGC